MFKFIMFLKEYIKRVTDHHLTAFSAQAAFFTVLSFFPFIMSLIGLIQFFPVNAGDVTNIIMSFIPDVFYDYVEPIVLETMDNSSGALLSLSIIVMIWAEGKGIMSMKNGFNTVAGVQNYPNYIVARIVASFYTLIFSLVFIILIVVMVFGNRIIKALLSESDFWSDIAVYFGTFRVIIIIAILLLFFLFFYCIIPDEKLSVRNAAPGAFFATFGWILISLLFSIFIDNFSNFTVMYGSLTGIILTLLWLYFCMFLLFLGCELNHCLMGTGTSTKPYIPE